jgi:hypothetical protein
VLEKARWWLHDGEAFEVLGGGCEQELLGRARQAAQPQASQADVPLQLCETRLHRAPRSGCLDKSGCPRQSGGRAPGRIAFRHPCQLTPSWRCAPRVQRGSAPNAVTGRPSAARVRGIITRAAAASAL